MIMIKWVKEWWIAWDQMPYKAAVRVLKATPIPHLILTSGKFEWLVEAVQLPRSAAPKHAWLCFSLSYRAASKQTSQSGTSRRYFLLLWLTVYLRAHTSSYACIRSFCSWEFKEFRHVWALQTWAFTTIRSGRPDLENTSSAIIWLYAFVEGHTVGQQLTLLQSICMLIVWTCKNKLR